ncbi:hypothetical protein GF323_04805 [Candidatus Woesearchaeota archaeon]|nr:hypothetical protein [Candidatus Woesearchaeota archaeon]
MGSLSSDLKSLGSKIKKAEAEDNSLLVDMVNDMTQQYDKLMFNYDLYRVSLNKVHFYVPVKFSFDNEKSSAMYDNFMANTFKSKKKRYSGNKQSFSFGDYTLRFNEAIGRIEVAHSYKNKIAADTLKKIIATMTGLAAGYVQCAEKHKIDR